jgi:hypothetical protein
MTLRLLLVFLFTAGLSLGASPPPVPTAPVAAPEWTELFGGASLPVIWQSIEAAAAKANTALAAGRTTGVATWAETVHLGAHALVDQVTPEDPERAKRLHAVLEHAARLADEVIAAAGRKEIDLAAAAHRRLLSALALARLRLPPAITNAPPATLREVPPSPPAPQARP